MKNNHVSFRYLSFFLIVSLLASCVSSKKINYFQKDEYKSINEYTFNYESPLQIADMLTINVSAIDEESVRPFNLFEVQTVAAQVPMAYLIDADGNINFPVIGKVKAAKRTTKQLTDYLTESLEPYLKNPIINIRVTNFSVTVLGEVRNPGRYPVINERLSILEAIGLAGDLTIYGDRRNIMLVREQNGERIITHIDLTDKELFDSPFFYLAQNDALYIPSNKTKVNSAAVGPNISIIISAFSVLITLVAILIR